METYDLLIVGAGLFGAVFAHEARKQGKRCLVIDRRNHTGGNIHCQFMEGIHVHQYGAHIFHTNNREVWNYVNQLVEMVPFVNSPLANYHGELYNLPFNMNTFHQLWGVNTPQEAVEELERQRERYAHITHPANFEEQALKLCGHDIYTKLIKGYTEKQWGRSTQELPAAIIRRVPLRMTYDNNYFNDTYQGIPRGGYNSLTDALLNGIEVRLNTNYLEQRNAFNALARKVVFTGQIDSYFDYRAGHLEYRSLHFETELLHTDNYQGNAVVNYTAADVPYTRIIEHKHFEHGQQPVTVITREYPKAYRTGDEPYYPVNDSRNNAIVKQYQELAARQSKTIFGGRLGQYAYFDMDDTIEAALLLAWKELTSSMPAAFHSYPH